MSSEGMGQGTGRRDDPATTGGGEDLKERTVETVAEVDAAAMHVAGVAGDEAGHVAHEAKRAARGFFDETRMQVTEQASTQQRRAAEALRSAGDELSEMARGSQSDGMAAGFVRGIGRQSREAASWLEQREPADLVQEVRGFARRHTGAFLVAAVGLGIVAGRLTRALMAERSGGAEGGMPGGASARPATPVGVSPGTGVSPSTGTGAGYGAAGGGYGAATGGYGTTAGGQGMPASGVGESIPGAGIAAGDTPIGDALAGEPAEPGTTGTTTPGTGAQDGSTGADGTVPDEWSASGEARR